MSTMHQSFISAKSIKLVPKMILLAKALLYWVLEWIYTRQLPPECQGIPCSKKARYVKFKWLQQDLNP